MAVAFAALQDKEEPADAKKDPGYQKDKGKHKQEMNDIVARTLAATE